MQRKDSVHSEAIRIHVWDLITRGLREEKEQENFAGQ